jgi:hypothetical protein
VAFKTVDTCAVKCVDTLRAICSVAAWIGCALIDIDSAVLFFFFVDRVEETRHAGTCIDVKTY